MVQYVVNLVDEGMTLTAVRRVLELEQRVKELEAQRDALQAELEAHREALQAAVAERDARLARLTASHGEGGRAPAPEVPDP